MDRVLIFLGFLFASLTDATAQWTIQNSHTTAALRGIHYVGHDVAWASGAGGTILKTTDGGLLWQICPTLTGADKLDFRGIQGFDQNTAIVMSSGKGDLSRLYKTTDGCRSWIRVLTNPDKDGFWDAIRFTPEYGEGVLFGDPVNGNFVIYTTHDTGATWKPWPSVLTAMKDESLFAASNSAAVVPGASGPFAFVTGGASGSRLLSPSRGSQTKLPFPANESSGAFSVASRPHGKSRLDLMIVGGDYKLPDTAGTAVWLASGRGAVRSSHPPHGYRSAVAYDAGHKLWITVGPNGTDVSTDDGRNWRALKPLNDETPDADRNWNALSLPFAVGPGGRIGKLSATRPWPNRKQ